MSDTDFTQSMDAKLWAEAFVKMAKEQGPDFATDEGTMIGWFANSIMRGYDEGRSARDGELAAANAENLVLRDAINDALPWMIKLGDYIGNGTQADPMGRCNAILKMRIAVETRNAKS